MSAYRTTRYDGQTSAVYDAIHETNRRGERPDLDELVERIKPTIPAATVEACVEKLVRDGEVFYAADGYRVRQYVPNVELDEDGRPVEAATPLPGP